MAIGGLDIGTTGCKITVYDDGGRYLFKAYRDYPVSRSESSHEVDCNHIWASVQQVIREAAGKEPDLKGIGVTSFGETFVLLDEHDEPLLPSMIYTDPRGEEQCKALISRLGEKKLRHITGLNPHIMYSISKIMWIRDNKPDIYKKAKRILLMQDYIVYMLTGAPQIDYSLATRTMAFDIRSLSWSDEILAAAEVEKGLLSETVPPGTAARYTVKKDLGLPEGTVIVSAGHDQIVTAIGSNVFSEDTAANGAGTVECTTPMFKKIPESDIMYDGNYAIVPYVIPGTYVCYSFLFTGGALLKWYIDNLAVHEKLKAEAGSFSAYELLEDGTQCGPTGILVLPHFAGAATPYMDSYSKGVIAGLTLAHTGKDLFRAVMEGISYETMLNIENLNEAGINFGRIFASGGGANSKVWMQIKADIFNIPVTALDTIEAGAAGCAMLTGAALGIFESLESAAKAVIREKETFYPRADMHREYMKVYERYKKLYNAVRPLV